MAIGNKIASCWIAINQCFTSNRDKKQAFISRVSHYEHRCRRGQGEQNGGQKENTNPYLSPFAVLIMIDTHISRSFSLDRMHLLLSYFKPQLLSHDFCFRSTCCFGIQQQVTCLCSKSTSQNFTLHFLLVFKLEKKMISSDCFSVN